MQPKLSLENVNFSFGKEKTINDFSLSVEEGSFTTLLGPSGCGKTTLLRLISGFLEPDSGTIKIDGVNQCGIDVNKRKIGMVFQDYALFPHMTVEQNLFYGLKVQKKSAEEAKSLVEKSSEALGIKSLLSRFPHELSGGQQQRVALGRALVLEPALLLMDEPLSSLDTKLRTKVREELKEIQESLKITTIYVTHDQEEALSLSTNIAVLDHGRLLQSGTPRQLYFEPLNKFTADFVGKANFLNDSLMIRPEWFALGSKENFDVRGKIISSSFLGNKTRFKVQDSSDGQILTADLDTIFTESLKRGDDIFLKAVHSWEMQRNQ